MSENEQKQKVERKEEERSYALLYFFSGLVLIGVSGWVLYNEGVVRRPWKAFQKQFNKLEYNKLKAQYDTQMREMEAPEKNTSYKQAKERLDKARQAFNKPEVQKEYHELQSELTRLQKKELEPLRFELADVNNKRMAEDYLYTKFGNEENKKKLEVLQKKGREIEEKIKGINGKIEEVRGKIAHLTADIDKATEEVESFTAKREKLRKDMEMVKARYPRLDDKQVYIEATNEVDRCMSCHVGINAPESVSADQPFAHHPGGYIYIKNHVSNEFGCVSCHRGQGRATTSVEKAHGEVEYWLTPILKGQQTQASCIKCHGNVDGLKGGQFIGKGVQIFRDRGCTGCHKTKGFEDEKIGPSLNNVGKKVNYNWLLRWLKNPKDYLPQGRMPNFKLSDEEIKAIADFLMSLSVDKRNLIAAQQVESDEKLAEKGKTRFNQHRCVICHPVDGKGGDVYYVYAPDLVKVASKVNREWLTGFLKNPKSHNPSTAMPQFRFEGEDAIKEIVEFISFEYVDWDVMELEEKGETLDVAGELEQKLIKEGETLVRKYGCYGCHEIKGFEGLGKVGPELTGFGSKPVDLLDFGKGKQVPHTWEGWVTTKLESPRIFRDGLQMPEFGFTTEEIQALIALLVGFTEETVPEKFKVPKNVSSYKPQGAFGKIVNEVNCLICHEINGRGGKYAPMLTYEGSRVNRKWLEKFLMSPDLIRPMLQQMPKFGFSADEVKVIADYLQTVLVNDELSLKKLPDGGEWELPIDDGPKKFNLPADWESDVNDGKSIYYRKGCQVCHQIGNAGGAVGPNLSDAGNRLTVGYIFNHIKHPAKWGFLPIAPDYALSNNEAYQITSYLSSLKD
ncbi:MAG: c-type cytochrome [Candidatus Brocadia sp.]